MDLLVRLQLSQSNHVTLNIPELLGLLIPTPQHLLLVLQAWKVLGSSEGAGRLKESQRVFWA